MNGLEAASVCQLETAQLLPAVGAAIPPFQAFERQCQFVGLAEVVTIVRPSIALSLLLVVGCLSACSGQASTSSTARIPAANGGTVHLGDKITVMFPPGALAADTTVSIRPVKADGELPGATPVSAAYEVSTGGVALVSAISVRLGVSPSAVPKGPEPSLAFVATLDETTNSWQSHDGTLNGTQVAAEIPHLTKIRAFRWVPKALADRLVGAYVDVLRFVGQRASPPVCDKPPNDITLKVVPVLFEKVPGAPEIDEKELYDMVLACPASSDGKSVTAKVVNNRSYSLLLDRPAGFDAKPAPPGRLSEDLARFLQGIFSDKFFLPSGTEAAFSVPVAPGGSVQLRTKASQLSLFFDAAFSLWHLIVPSDKYVAMAECVYKTVGAGADGPASLDKVPEVVRDCAGPLLDSIGRTALGLAYGLVEQQLKSRFQELDTNTDHILGGGEDIVVASTAKPVETTTTTSTRPMKVETTVKRFYTPSRNISCGITGDGVRCDVMKHDWVPPPKPVQCEYDYGFTLVLGHEGPKFGCVSDAVVSVETVIVPYGTSVRQPGFSCDVTEAGVTCRDSRNSHGFFVSKASYDLF